MSGGERRRVEIARALATHPSYILLDEPLAGIDPIAVGEIRDLVRHLKDRGIGVLITDHNVRDALDIIDRAYIIHDGQVLKEGTPATSSATAMCAGSISASILALAITGHRGLMAITQRLEMRQGQSLVMTPQLQQAIKLLQLSNLELAAFVEQELERNPLLERDESSPTQANPRSHRELPPDNSSTDTLLAREDFSSRGHVDAEHEDMDYAGETSPPAPNLPLADWSGLRTGTVSPDQDSFLERALARPAFAARSSAGATRDFAEPLQRTG